MAGGQEALRKRPYGGHPAERGHRTREDEDVQMATEAETGHMEDMCSITYFKCPSCGEGDFGGGGGFLGNSVGVCAGKQMLETIAAVEKTSSSTATAFTAP